MKPQMLSAIARMTGGHVVGEDVAVDTLVTDTRPLHGASAADATPGNLFVAIKGDNFDGHDHVVGAAQAGVTAALVDHRIDAAIPQVVVADTRRALADWAGAVQRERTGKAIAITGSNGKTTVKSLLLGILDHAAAGSAYANPGNRNNEIGLPLAVLDAPDDATFAIYEMGAGQPGDIAYLTQVVRPDVALVNNVAPAHLERMGSLLGIADTKAAIYDALPTDGVAVINADDAFAPYFGERAHGRRLVRFGLDASADITARDVKADVDGSRFVLVTPQGEAAIALAMPGRHNVRNALAAASLALAAGASLVSVEAGLNAAQAVSGRLVAHRLAGDVVLVDDSYNANPGSLAAAIDTLAEAPGDAWLVLGDMRELGDDAAAMHAEAGRRARAAGIQRLYALGPLSAAAAQAFGQGATQYDSHAALTQALRSELAAQPHAGLRLLVKGSRGSAMEKIVAALISGSGAPVSQQTTGEGSTDVA